jgi:hypothetical protein
LSAFTAAEIAAWLDNVQGGTTASDEDLREIEQQLAELEEPTSNTKEPGSQ